MKHPFPGMNPWLEHPSIWPGVHHGIIESIRDSLASRIAPKYLVAIEERVYADEDEVDILGIPDASVAERRRPDRVRDAATTQALPYQVRVPLPIDIRESYLEIRKTQSRRVVTVIEVLSPTNKRPGRGRRSYLKKRSQVLGSQTNLVEIDLLRGGRRMKVHSAPTMGDYRILVSRAWVRPRADLYPFGVRDTIPQFHVPLGKMDLEPDLELGSLLHALYDRAQYHLHIDYRTDPVPPLADSDRNWATEVLLDAKLR